MSVADISKLEKLANEHSKLRESKRKTDAAKCAITIIESISSPDFDFNLRKEALATDGNTTYVYENGASYPSLFDFLGEILHSKIPILIGEARFGPAEIIITDENRQSADLKLANAIKDLQSLVHAKKAAAST